MNMRTLITWASLITLGSANVAIIGAAGGIQPRQEIRTLAQNADQFNIYLLSLEKMHAMSINDPQSFFQVAGIHGAPYVAWDGVQQCSGCPNTGYCTHYSSLFSTWHRPYVALYEQILQGKALEAAHEFSGDFRDRYIRAASTLRAPYWDWAMEIPPGDNSLPNVVMQQTINVVKPSGATTIANPLFSFDLTSSGLQAVRKDAGSAARQRSYRASDCVQQSNRNMPDLQRNIYDALSSISDCDTFSNNMVGGSSDNLESIHGTPHLYLGGFMSRVELAGFDPVFFLHHAMVDRVFALWQALYSDSWMRNRNQLSSTYSFKYNDIEGGSSPLKPFHSDAAGGFWTSDRARDWTAFGYTYPELGAGFSSSSVAAAINSQYGGDSLASPDASTKRKRAIDTGSIDGLVSENGIVNQYSIRISASRGSFNGSSFAVHVFNGNFDATDPSSWSAAPNYLGMKGFLQSASMLPSANDAPPLAGKVPLTSKLIRLVGDGELPNLTKTAVSNFVRNVRVAILKADRTLASPSEVDGLALVLTRVGVQPASSAEHLPRYGPTIEIQIIDF